MIKRVWFLQHLCPKLGFTKNRVAYFDIGTLVMGHLGQVRLSAEIQFSHVALKLIFFFQIFLFKNFF